MCRLFVGIGEGFFKSMVMGDIVLPVLEALEAFSRVNESCPASVSYAIARKHGGKTGCGPAGRKIDIWAMRIVGPGQACASSSDEIS